jgi:hypothetical protein
LFGSISIVRYISRAVSCVVTMRSLGGNLTHMVTPPPAGSAPRIRFFLQGNAQVMRDLSTVLNRRLAEHGVANMADPKPSAKCSGSQIYPRRCCWLGSSELIHLLPSGAEVSMKNLNADILSEVVDRERRILSSAPSSASSNTQAKTPITPAANNPAAKSNSDQPSDAAKEPRCKCYLLFSITCASAFNAAHHRLAHLQQWSRPSLRRR